MVTVFRWTLHNIAYFVKRHTRIWIKLIDNIRTYVLQNSSLNNTTFLERWHKLQAITRTRSSYTTKPPQRSKYIPLTTINDTENTVIKQCITVKQLTARNKHFNLTTMKRSGAIFPGYSNKRPRMSQRQKSFPYSIHSELYDVVLLNC